MFDEEGDYKQCYELVDENEIDAKTLDEFFKNFAEYIRNSKEFDIGKRNVVTIIFDSSSKKIDIKQYDKSIGLYKIKKEWKSYYLN